MNILFLTIGQIHDLNGQSVHIDLITALKQKGHNISVLCTNEKRYRQKTQFVTENGINILRLKIGNLTRCSIIEKGISTLLLQGQFKRAIKKYFGKEKFDLVIYNTPPITLAKPVKFCKKKFGCRTYLLLKDIFPQNAVDIGILKKNGLKGLIYKAFRNTEKKLYKYSDRIGCMSHANMEYLLRENKEIDTAKVEIFPNAVNFNNIQAAPPEQTDFFAEFQDKTVFVFGGNLGKPQGLDFLVKGITACEENALPAHFAIVGGGTEKERIFEKLKDCSNVTTYKMLPQSEYLSMMDGAHVGLIMLDYRFTIPNYPSRMLSYMQNSKPVLACTDKITDIKELVEEQAKCGKWCYSDDVSAFTECVRWFTENKNELEQMGQNGNSYLREYFNTDICVGLLEAFSEKNKDGYDVCLKKKRC